MALTLLHSQQTPLIESVLTILLNALVALPGETILVLDDYHLVQTPSIHDALTYLIDHLPANLHLVIASRLDPPLPLAQLRARAALTELRAADLRFTLPEATTFLTEAMGLPLSTEESTALEARTEGWIAGLHLAALSLQDRDDLASFIAAFTGSHRYVVDYLVEEVLQRQPEDVQQFLLRTCLLDRLSGPLCDTVLGRDDSQHFWNTWSGPTCSLSHSTMSGSGTAITISLPRRCAAARSRRSPRRPLTFTIAPASGTSSMRCSRRRCPMPWQLPISSELLT